MIKQRGYRPSATPPSATGSSVTLATTPERVGPAAPPPAASSTSAPPTSKPRAAKAVSKGTELGQQIGHKLKTMFTDLVAEPVPEKFRQLLEELERKSGKP